MCILTYGLSFDDSIVIWYADGYAGTGDVSTWDGGSVNLSLLCNVQ